MCATPLILVFSLIIALLLNGKYRFALFPCGILSACDHYMSGLSLASYLLSIRWILLADRQFFYTFVQSLPAFLSTPVMFILNNLVLILWFSVVPILIFCLESRKSVLIYTRLRRSTARGDGKSSGRSRCRISSRLRSSVRFTRLLTWRVIPTTR